QRKSASRDDRPARRQVLDEARLAERPIPEPPLDLLLRKVAPHPIKAAFQASLRQNGRKLLVVFAARIDQHMTPAARSGGEDLGPQDGWEQASAFLPDFRPKKSGDEILIAKWEFALDESLGEVELGEMPTQHTLRQRAAIDDLHIVDREDRKAVQLPVEV